MTREYKGTAFQPDGVMWAVIVPDIEAVGAGATIEAAVNDARSDWFKSLEGLLYAGEIVYLRRVMLEVDTPEGPHYYEMAMPMTLMEDSADPESVAQA